MSFEVKIVYSKEIIQLWKKQYELRCPFSSSYIICVCE